MTPDERNELVLQNLGIAGKAAKAFRRKHRCVFLDYEDLFQAAVVGLVKAAEDYDPENGRFSTWANYKMRPEMQALLCDTETVLSIPAGYGGRFYTEANEQYQRAFSRRIRDEVKPDLHAGAEDDVDLKIDVQEAMAEIDRLRRVPLLYFFGFKDGSLDSAAEDLGVSRQRAHYLKNMGVSAIRKLLKSYEEAA